MSYGNVGCAITDGGGAVAFGFEATVILNDDRPVGCTCASVARVHITTTRAKVVGKDEATMIVTSETCCVVVEHIGVSTTVSAASLPTSVSDARVHLHTTTAYDVENREVATTPVFNLAVCPDNTRVSTSRLKHHTVALMCCEGHLTEDICQRSDVKTNKNATRAIVVVIPTMVEEEWTLPITTRSGASEEPHV